MRSFTKVLGTIAAAGFALGGSAQTQNTIPAPTPAFTFAGRGIEVGIGVSDLHRSASFYGGILGLRVIDDSAVAPAFAAGASTIRLHGVSGPSPRTADEVMAINGFRLLTILVEGSQAVAQRFVAAGLSAPTFSPPTGPEQFRVAFVSDPDGNVIELVAFDTTASGGLTGFQIGLTVADASASRDFYGRLLGLPSRTPIPLPPTIARDTLQHMFRAETAMIKFWAPPGTRSNPAKQIETTPGIRYLAIVVTDLKGATQELRARGALVTETSADRVRIADPDGNSIELTTGDRR